MVRLRLAVPGRFDTPKIKRIRNYLAEEESLVQIGQGTYGSDNLVIHNWDLSTKVSIGKYCQIADNVHIFLGGNHDWKRITTFPFSKDSTINNLFGTQGGSSFSKGNIEIGNDVWIASHVSIMSGVKIGSGAVIGAYSHVTRDVKPYEIVTGNPATHMRFRFSEEIIESLLALAWWDWDAQEIIDSLELLLGVPDSSQIKEISRGRFNKKK
jgi:acetyltransferase-like isoleucine patch superfamily enzyme